MQWIIYLIMINFFSVSAAENQAFHFMAAEYFSTIAPDQPRNPKWPKRVTIEPQVVDLETMRTLLSGTFRVVAHCSGRPLTADETAAIPVQSYHNGYQTSFRVWTFNTEDNTFETTLVPGLKAEDGVQEAQFETTGGFMLVPLYNREGHFAFIPTDKIKYFIDQVLVYAKIIETGEKVILMEEEHSRVNCPQGETFLKFYAPNPQS